MPFPNFTGNKRFWTRERVITALILASGEIKGPLPCCDAVYNRIKKGRLDWPTSRRILEYFGAMARAWRVAGAPMSRVTMRNLDWQPEEKEYLLNYAGRKTIATMAKRLGRSYAAIRKEMQSLHIRARDNEGYLSAAQMTKELHCSCDRLRRFLNAGIINGATFDMVRNRWKIDPVSITPEILDLLTRKRKTHNTWPLDQGDYYARYGIVRHIRKEPAGVSV